MPLAEWRDRDGTDLSQPMLDAAAERARRRRGRSCRLISRRWIDPLPDAAVDLIRRARIWNLDTFDAEFRAAPPRAARFARPGGPVVFTFRAALSESATPVPGERSFHPF